MTVAILAYNEADNLRWLLPEIKKYVDQLDLQSVEYLIVDSMKPTDDTEQVCKEFGAIYVNQTEEGYGGAMRTAFKCASRELFLILDADGSQDYTQIPKLYEQICQGADVVLGSRYMKGGKTDDSKSSQIMSKVLNKVYTTALGIKAKDISGSFRIYHTADLKDLCLTCRNFDIAEEVLLKLKLKNKNLDIREVPISFVKRTIGESKRSLVRFIVSFAKTLVSSICLRVIASRGYHQGEDEKTALRFTQLFFYGIFGLLTTIVNVGVYALFLNALNIDYLFANVIAWIIAVIFAFITNKTCVFDSWDWNKSVVVKEGISFFTSRIFTGIADMLLLWTLVSVLNQGELFSKVVDSIVVIILNYVLSKVLVFNNKIKS